MRRAVRGKTLFYVSLYLKQEDIEGKKKKKDANSDGKKIIFCDSPGMRTPRIAVCEQSAVAGGVYFLEMKQNCKRGRRGCAGC